MTGWGMCVICLVYLKKKLRQLHSSGWPWTFSPLASASGRLGLQAGIPHPKRLLKICLGYLYWCSWRKSDYNFPFSLYSFTFGVRKFFVTHKLGGIPLSILSKSLWDMLVNIS
jgi:hypothetical protein